MTKNEKKMFLDLAKCFVHQLDLNLKLINMLPEDLAKEANLFQDNIEVEMQNIIKLVQEEWNSDEES